MTTFILIHGAWHGGWCWERIVPLLEQQGHRVLAPDLPGMGNDSTPLATITLDYWAQFVADLVRQTPRVAVYDPMAATDNQYRMAASEIIVQDLKAFHLAIAEENFQVLFEPELPVQDEDNPNEWFYSDFRPFLQKIWRRVQLIGPMMVVIDEAHYTMSKRTMPVEVLNIITNGRRRF